MFFASTYFEPWFVMELSINIFPANSFCHPMNGEQEASFANLEIPAATTKSGSAQQVDDLDVSCIISIHYPSPPMLTAAAAHATDVDDNSSSIKANRGTTTTE
jgi:hypothetical protein